MDIDRNQTTKMTMTEKEAANVIGVSVRTLQSWRMASRGPRYARLGGSIRYRMSDLVAYIDDCVITPALTPLTPQTK